MYVQTHRAFQGSSLGMPWVVLKRTKFCLCGGASQVHSPQILLASLMSLGMMVTCLAMDGAEVGILKQFHEVRFGSLLEC